MTLPTDEEKALFRLLQREGKDASEHLIRPRVLRTVTGHALAEIGSHAIDGLGDGDKRGMIVEWHKAKKTSPMTIKATGVWKLGLPDEFDWLPAAELILNNGCPIRLTTEPNEDILKFPTRRQA
jgi:hypothetical protein